MPSIHKEIIAALANDTDIAREKVATWIAAAGTDLKMLSSLYRLTEEGYYRIKPELGEQATYFLIQKYLLECIRQDVKDDEGISDRWEAADTLHIWLRQLLEMENTPSIIAAVVDAITELCLASGEDIRNAIEYGFLEHALETEGLRPYFESWSSNPQLRDAWEHALEWGKAHPNHMWLRLQEIPRLREK